MIIELLQGDITTIAVDVIVNAANSSLLGGGGVDGAIHRKGGKIIMEECYKIRQRQGGCKEGHVVYTSAGNLPANYVIHAVGHIWRGGDEHEPDMLWGCYMKALKLAESLGQKTISFPNISTGVYGYPKKAAAEVALQAVKEYQYSNPQIEKVYFVCFDEENYQIYKKML